MIFAWSSDWSPFGRLRGEINRLFERPFVARTFLPWWHERTQRFARVNMTETEDTLTVECEVPGVAKEDIDISVEGGLLTIRGERKAPEDHPPECYRRRERGSGPFERTLELPAQVDVENVTAKLSGGVLEVVLPKRPDAKPKRIDVKLG